MSVYSYGIGVIVGALIILFANANLSLWLSLILILFGAIINSLLMFVENRIKEAKGESK